MPRMDRSLKRQGVVATSARREESWRESGLACRRDYRPVASKAATTFALSAISTSELVAMIRASGFDPSGASFNTYAPFATPLAAPCVARSTRESFCRVSAIATQSRIAMLLVREK